MVRMIFFIFLWLLTLYTYSQSETIELKGLWEIFENPSDTINEDSEGIFWMINDTTVQSLISFGGGLHPEPIGEEIKYTYSNNKLVVSDKKEGITYLVSIINEGSIILTDNKKNSVFLKKE